MTRAQQKEERKKAILMTGLALFVERGYYETKITDIAAAVPMSTGLMFHYFESKEELLLELVKMGVGMTKPANEVPDIPPELYLTGFVKQIFNFAKEQPWVFNMFVLMGQARRMGMPEEARKLALTVDASDSTAELVRKGQKSGVFRKGDAKLMARCFWSSIQGIMEEMSMDKEMEAPDSEWLVSMLKA